MTVKISEVKIWDAEGGEVDSSAIVRMKLFLLTKAKMQMKSRGVIQMRDGSMRIINVRHSHNPDMRGHLVVVGEALPGSGHPMQFEGIADGLEIFEGQWGPVSLPEFREGDGGLPPEVAELLT